MKCLLLITVFTLTSLAECNKSKDADKKDRKDILAELSTPEDKSPDKIDTLKAESTRTSIDKRQLAGQFFHVPKGNAYSYTHVVQSHGPSRKVVHSSTPVSGYPEDHLPNQHAIPNYSEDGYNSYSAPGDHGDDDYGYYEPTKEPYYGPIYVTAKPVLPTKPEDYKSGRTITAADNNLRTHGVIPLTYPLFRPFYSNVADKPYTTVPVQVVYRVPYQGNFAYQHLQHPYAIDWQQNNYNQLPNYQIDRPLAYTIQKPYLSQIAANGGSLSYPYYLKNNYISTYPNSVTDLNPQDETTDVNGEYSSDESNR